MDSLFVIDSAADILVCATLMWAGLCSAALWSSRDPARPGEAPSVSQPASSSLPPSHLDEETRLAA